jgi:hypothetical protein
MDSSGSSKPARGYGTSEEREPSGGHTTSERANTPSSSPSATSFSAASLRTSSGVLTRWKHGSGPGRKALAAGEDLRHPLARQVRNLGDHHDVRPLRVGVTDRLLELGTCLLEPRL